MATTSDDLLSPPSTDDDDNDGDDDDDDTFAEDDLILLCQQSMSVHVLACPFVVLARSNAQLGAPEAAATVVRGSSSRQQWRMPENVMADLGNSWLCVQKKKQ